MHLDFKVSKTFISMKSKRINHEIRKFRRNNYFKTRIKFNSNRLL